MMEVDLTGRSVPERGGVSASLRGVEGAGLWNHWEGEARHEMVRLSKSKPRRDCTGRYPAVVRNWPGRRR